MELPNEYIWYHKYRCEYTVLIYRQPYSKADIWLIGPRAELSFSKSVFFNAFQQYNNQANNFNINARFQWRFKPVSDFYLVYTDNYFASDDPLSFCWRKTGNCFYAQEQGYCC